MHTPFPIPLPPFVTAKRSPDGLPPGWSLAIPGVSTHYLLMSDAVFEDRSFAERYVAKRLAEYCSMFGKAEEYSSWVSSQKAG